MIDKILRFLGWGLYGTIVVAVAITLIYAMFMLASVMYKFMPTWALILTICTFTTCGIIGPISMKKDPDQYD